MDQEYYCYKCSRTITPNHELLCPHCGEGFIEASSAVHSSTQNNRPSISLRFSTSGPSDRTRSTATSSAARGRELPISASSGDSESPAPADDRRSLMSLFRQILEPNMVTGGLEFNSIGELESLLSQVTTLLDALSSPAQPADLSLISTTRMTAGMLKDHSACSICLEAFYVDESLSILPCSHLFHQNCIMPWFQERNTCPVCRRQLSSESSTSSSSATGDEEAPSAPVASAGSSSSTQTPLRPRVTLVNAGSSSDTDNVMNISEDEENPHRWAV